MSIVAITERKTDEIEILTIPENVKFSVGKNGLGTILATPPHKKKIETKNSQEKINNQKLIPKLNTIK